MTTAQEWLDQVRGLDLENVTRYGVKFGPSQIMNGDEAVGIPYVQNGELKSYKVRRAGARQDHDRPFDWSPRGAKVSLWNVDVLSDKTLADHPLIITEGEFDALAVIECGFPRTVSVPHGAQSGPKYLFEHADKITGRVIIAGDADEDGEKFIRAAAATLEGVEVRYCVWPDGCKDANDTLAKFGAQSVVEAIHSARVVFPDDPEGGMITGFSDAPPPPSGAIYRTGDPTADRVICFHEGFPTIVTGSPSAGKSTFLTWALWAAGRQHKIRNGVCLMETPWPELRDQLSRMETGRVFAEHDRKRQDELAARWDLNWRLMHRKEDDGVVSDLWWVREMMRTAAVRDGCKIITFDPWNELEHTMGRGEAMTDYVNGALAQMRQWAERFDVALCIVAHPTKMQREAGGKIYPPTGYDIAGSAAWFNKAAIGVTVHRVEDDNGEHTRVINWKSKFQQKYGITKGMVRMDFDVNKMLYRRRMHG